jgi:riboflavin synthase
LLRIDASGWEHSPSPGDSICVNGVCLTVAAWPGQSNTLVFDVVPETIARTTLGAMRERDLVNLEHSVTPRRLMGGHIVQGHVDATAEIVGVQRESGEHRLRVRVPRPLMQFVVEKGSVALDGISLTVASVGDDWLEVALIPTTLRETTLGSAAVGMRLNLETDYIAKVVANWLRRTR